MSCFTGGRLGRTTQVLIQKEDSYGTLTTFAGAGNVSMACKCEMTPTINTTDIPYKTGTKAPVQDSTVKTTTGGVVVLSGAFNDGYEWLLEAYTGTAASPHIMQDILDPSYEIHRQHTDATEKDDIATGCVCESLNFTAAQGGVLMFEATFNAKAITWEAAPEGTWAAPKILPFQFAGSTLTDGVHTITAPTSYACNLSGEMLPDDLAFNNKKAKSCNMRMAFSGEVTYEDLYLSTNPISTALQVAGTTVIVATFLNGEAGAGTSTLGITTNGKFTRDLGEPDTGLFKVSTAQTLGAASPEDVLNIAYATT